MFAERFIFLFTVFCVYTVIFQLRGSTLLYFSSSGKKKKARETKSGRSSHLSHISPSPCLLLPPLRFPLLTAISSLFCTLCPIALSVSLQCWLGGQEDDGCIWGLRGRRCRICLTCSSKDSVSSSLSSNGAPGSLRHGGKWRIACVYVRAHARVCMTVTEKHWWMVAGVPEDGIRERHEEDCR